jgi:hypothetical protein
VTSQGHSLANLRRALERGNLVAAELAAHEAGRLDLSEALELTALVALRERERGRRYALRWLARWLEEADVTLDEAVTVAACLAALGGPSHHRALQALRAACETRLAA